MNRSADVVIVGGGVIGLAVAWRLARRGFSVTALDAGQPGQASTAAAGMLAPLAEMTERGPLVDLGIASLRQYPEFLAALSEDADTPLTLAGPGMMRVAVTEPDAQRLSRAFAWQKTLGLPLEWLDGQAARAQEPALSSSVQAALLSPLEQHLPPRLLHEALRNACVRRGVTLRSAAVCGFEQRGQQVLGVKTAEGTIGGGEVVIAGGAWSREMSAWLGVECPVSPVRGQILALGPLAAPLFRHTVYASHGYLVPRPDGRVVVGATEEKTGFTVQTTAEGIGGLLHMACSLVPELGSAALDSVWAGLRPVSADGLPLVGRSPAWENISLATGHGRNGILLTPVTASLLEQVLAGGAAPPAAFAADRFGAAR